MWWGQFKLQILIVGSVSVRASPEEGRERVENTDAQMLEGTAARPRTRIAVCGVGVPVRRRRRPLRRLLPLAARESARPTAAARALLPRDRREGRERVMGGRRRGRDVVVAMMVVTMLVATVTTDKLTGVSTAADGALRRAHGLHQVLRHLLTAYASA